MTHVPSGDNNPESFESTDSVPMKQAMTFSLSLTPLKIFLAGLVAGLLVMAIPTTFMAVKLSDGGPRLAGNDTIVPTQGEQAPPTPGKVEPVSDKDFIYGNKDAEVTLIEYSDTECPFCKSFHPTIKGIVDGSNGKVNWVYRHFPLGFHPNAKKQAEAAECAGEVGGSEKYYKFLDEIFARTQSGGTGFANDKLVPLAKELGINEKKFKECLDSGKKAADVDADFASGQAAGVDGTPGTLVVGKNGKTALLPGAVSADEIKAEIDRISQ